MRCFGASHERVLLEAHRLQSESVGDKDERCLTPAKLAAFYKAVGGNYDCALLYTHCII